jgi:hypothetical protein
MEPKWNASGSSTHLIGTRHRNPGVDSGRAFWEETDCMSQETDMKTARKQGIVRDDRGQTEPADKQRAQQSQMEGPAAYAPHEGEKKAKSETRSSKEEDGTRIRVKVTRQVSDSLHEVAGLWPRMVTFAFASDELRQRQVVLRR